MKKTIAKYAILFLFLHTLIGESDQKEPAALIQARKAYNAQVKMIKDPISKKYLAQLEELKKQLGGRGDLAGATAVQSEIDRLSAEKNGDREMDDVAKKIIIIDVKYGTGDKWKDITEMAKNAVKDNRLVISCSHSDFGDPAFGEAKKIVLRYKYEGGKEQTIEQGDGVPAIVIASKRSHKSQDFTVIEALYGAGKTWLDITDKISPYIKHGKLNLANYGDGRNLAGTDPADFITKSIVVRYAHKGEEFCKSFNDGSKIVLP